MAACGGRTCSQSSAKRRIISAMAGSPIQPKARPATVTPSWTAGRNSSMECLSLRAVRAPGRPRAMSCWMRVSRTLTRANSAATKKLVARMKKATMITRKSIHSSIHASVMECRQVYADRMNRRTFLSSSAYASAGLIAGIRPAITGDAAIEITVQPDGPEISPHIYGQFIEHLGGVIYDGVWVGPNSKIPNIGGIRGQFVEQ